MVKRGTIPPEGQPPPHPPPGPASRGPPPPSAHILQLYRDCVARGIWAKLIFETRGGEEQYSFFCSPKPGAAAVARRAAAGDSHRQGRKKRPPNQRRRERARRRREAWIERRNQSAQPSNATFAGTTAAGTKAAVSADLSAASVATAAVATAAAATTALRERCKMLASERRSSARALVIDQRRNSLVSGTSESPEKTRAEEEMNRSIRIQLEDGEIQREVEEEDTESSTHFVFPVPAAATQPEIERTDEKECEEGAEPEPLYRPPPTPPPWSRHFSNHPLRVLCTFCFAGNRETRNSRCSDCFRAERENLKK